MSETRDTSVNDVNTADEKKADVTPYISKQKDSHVQEKSNFVMPLILLVVSVIVIVATFYEDEYRNLVASVEGNDDVAVVSDDITETAAQSATQSDKPGILAAEAEVTAETGTQEDTTVADKTTVAEASQESTSGASGEVSRSDDIATDTQNSTADAAGSSGEETIAASPDQKTAEIPEVTAAPAATSTAIAENKAAIVKPSADKVYPDPRDSYVRYQQESQKQHELYQQRAAMMQQHRDELQARRNQRQQAMDHYRDQRSREYEALKAIYVQAQQKRSVDMDKIRQIHEQIEALHRELHDMINKSAARPVPGPLKESQI